MSANVVRRTSWRLTMARRLYSRAATRRAPRRHTASSKLERMGHRKGHSLGYGGMVQQHVVHFLRGNFFSTTVDGFLNTTGDEEVTSSIHIPLVTRPEPALGAGVLVGRSVVVVLHNACSTYHDLPSGTHGNTSPASSRKATAISAPFGSISATRSWRLMPMACNACTTSSTCRQNRPDTVGEPPDPSF